MPRIGYDGDWNELDSADALFERLSEDESLMFGSSDACVVLAGNDITLNVMRHPASGWYLEHQVSGSPRSLFDPDRNDTSWSSLILASDLVYDIDDDDVVWIKTMRERAEIRIRESCFTDDATTRNVLDKFVNDPDAFRALAWTSLDPPAWYWECDWKELQEELREKSPGDYEEDDDLEEMGEWPIGDDDDDDDGYDDDDDEEDDFGNPEPDDDFFDTDIE